MDIRQTFPCPYRLRILIQTATAAFLSFALAVSCYSANEEAKPRVMSPRAVYDFGTSDNHRYIRNNFPLRNIGNAPLIIHDVVTSCGCTVATIEKREIAPGEEGSVRAELSLHGRLGPMEKRLFVFSNDPDNPRLELAFVGESVAILDVEPEVIFMGPIAKNETVSRDIVIRYGKENAFDIEKIVVESDFFTAERLDNGQPMSYRVKVSNVQNLQTGIIKGNVRVFTGNAGFATIDIPVSAHVIDDILTVMPETIELSSLGYPRSVYIVLLKGTDRSYAVKKVDVPDPDIAVDIFPMENSNYRIRLSEIPSDRSLDGKEVVIHTDMEGRETLRLPIRVLDDEEGKLI